MNAEDFFIAGLRLATQGRLAEAAEQWAATLAAEPGHAQARFNRVLALGRLNRLDEAAAEAAEGARLHPAEPCFLAQFGQNLARLGRLDEAAAALRQALDRGDDPALWWALGLVERDRCAWDSARQALTHVEDQVEARFELAQLLLRDGEWRRGWELWESRLARPQAHEERWSIPEWTGGALDGIDLLVYGEQGAGDTIQMLRFVPELAARGATVRLAVHDALVGLLAGLPGVAQVLPLSAPTCPATRRVSIMSLPHRLSAADCRPGLVPYLTARPAALAGSGLKVGLVWAGSASFANAAQRHVGRPLLEALTAIPGLCLYSLQLDQAPNDPAVTDLAPCIKDWADTAGLIAALDLVVSVDTGTAHLAGAMGRPVWLLLHKGADWRWGHGSRTDWYPSARLYRQATSGEWGPVLQEVTEDLRRLT
jgi:tetratricopeptide (TPR) repeat protein